MANDQQDTHLLHNAPTSPAAFTTDHPAKKRITLLRNKASKRRETLIRKCDEIRHLCGAQVYLAVRLQGRLDIYESETSDTWPLTEQSVVATDVPIAS
ncbi:hypothetical protein QQS21_002083 [Conoideocrella luteorostrata]|uniref:MADS-box domain-containing protein n=1 Tax=Conoideocrella luteorostrata TaxID=1105319 RepID=A0AAJ0FWU5_9HYPO|nr:hypothetical protein QQS21_002083 [Conoideocrella luteorostrata]